MGGPSVKRSKAIKTRCSAWCQKSIACTFCSDSFLLSARASAELCNFQAMCRPSGVPGAKHGRAFRGFSKFDAMPLFLNNALPLIGPKLDSMSIESIPKFTGPAAALSAAIPAEAKKQLLSNVWCGKCRPEVIISNFTGTVKGGCLLLVGLCSECHGDVARVVEGN